MEAVQGWEVAGCLKIRSCSLNSLKGVMIIGDCVGDYYRVMKEDTRSIDCCSYREYRGIPRVPD